MSEHHVSKLTRQFEAFLDAFEKLDTYVLHCCMNDNEEDAVDSKTEAHLQTVLEEVLAKRAYLTSNDLDRMFRLFKQALDVVTMSEQNIAPNVPEDCQDQSQSPPSA